MKDKVVSVIYKMSLCPPPLSPLNSRLCRLSSISFVFCDALPPQICNYPSPILGGGGQRNFARPLFLLLPALSASATER